MYEYSLEYRSPLERSNGNTYQSMQTRSIDCIFRYI